MSSVTDMVLDDGATTPVAKTFKPIKVEPNLLTFNSSDYNSVSAEVYAGRPVLTLGNRLPSNQNGNYKATLRLRIPVLEASEVSAGTGTSLARPLAYTLSANVDVIIPSLASASEIKDLLAFVANSLADAQVVSTFTDMALPN
jgi:hypothetical protein